MESWSGFIAHCLHRRLTPDRFGKYAQQHHSRSPLSPNRLADVLLRPTEHDTECLDPLIPQYVQILLQADLIDVAAVLKGLLRYSTFQHNEIQKATREGGEEGDIERLRWNNSHVQEEALIYGMTKIVSSEARPKNENESLGLIVMLREWMEVLTIAAEHEVNVLHDLGTTSEGSGPEAVAVRIAFGTLLVATSENMRVLKILRKGCPKGARYYPVYCWFNGLCCDYNQSL
jgi:mediator of RNA polymerase II transcription subunit 5